MSPAAFLSGWAAFLWRQAPRELSLIASIISFAAWPFVFYALASRRIGAIGKLLAIGVGGSVAALSIRVSGIDGLLPFMEGFVYFCALVPVVSAIREGLRAGQLSRGAAAIALISLYAVTPAVFAPSAQYFVVQLRGWESMFAAYSFAVDGMTSDEEPSLAEGAFFLLVNPTLVYSQRARLVGPPRPSRTSVMRVLLGVLTLAGHSILFATVDGLFREAPTVTHTMTSYGYLAVLGYYLARFLAGYWAHSGRASVDIGLIRAFGFQVPERYRFPLLATDPADFWRRWNTYVGSWFRRYVFTPAAVGWQRRRIFSSGNAAMAAAVLATFLCGGLIHDFSAYLRFGRTGFGTTLAFGLHGVALVAWAIASEVRRRVPVPELLGRSLRPFGAIVGYALFLHVLVLSSWLAIPGMSDGGLPQELSGSSSLVR